MAACTDIDYVLAKLAGCATRASGRTAALSVDRRVRRGAAGVAVRGAETIPNTGAGEGVVAEVERVLGRPRGIRIGEAPDRDGQYFHYLAMWMFALAVLGRSSPNIASGDRAGARSTPLRRSRTAASSGRCARTWRRLSRVTGSARWTRSTARSPIGCWIEAALAPRDRRHARADRASYADSDVTQDLGIGMMLWMSHFFPDETWAVTRARCLATLDRMWVDAGYFCREPGPPRSSSRSRTTASRSACRPSARRRSRGALNAFFDTYRSGDEYDREAITHVMACSSHLPGYLLQGYA